MSENGGKIACFFIEGTDRERRSLRRFSSSLAGNRCPLVAGPYSYHNAKTVIGEGKVEIDPRGFRSSIDREAVPHEDPRWPVQCACGYRFTDADDWQVFGECLYRRTDTGEEMTLREAPPGALYYADWLKSMYAPTDDGHIIACITPGGEWTIDSEASNCTRKGDHTHHCWVRHGDPTDPQGAWSGQPFHVDKNGETCQAGAGSILCGSYHGYLHSGYLTPC